MSTLDVRYGRTRSHRRRGVVTAIVAVVVVAIATLVWALWTGVGGTATALEVTTTSVSPDQGSTTVQWLVTGRPRTTLVCAIEAQDPSGVVVGLVELTVRPTGSTDRSGTTVVRTVRPASTGLIDSCRDA